MRGAARAELAARLALLATRGIAGARALELVRTHGSALAALSHVETSCGAEAAAALHSDAVRERVKRALAAIDDEQITIIAYDDDTYPQRMRDRLGAHAPLLLFALGDAALLQRGGVGIVGARRASEYGLDMAAEIAQAVARAGGCVNSGVALGVDASAHAAALDSGGATIGVLGCGVDVCYPRDNTTLQRRIAAEGLLLSELLPGEPPLRHHFPHRNRIIAALSDVVVVVEAAAKSGAISTIVHAANQGLPTFGVMNMMHAPSFAGVLGLMRDGLAPMLAVEDVLLHAGLIGLGEAPPEPRAAAVAPPADPLQATLWEALPGHLDALAQAAGVESQRALGALLEMELDGRIERRAGQRFARAAARRPLPRNHA